MKVDTFILRDLVQAYSQMVIGSPTGGQPLLDAANAIIAAIGG